MQQHAIVDWQIIPYQSVMIALTIVPCSLNKLHNYEIFFEDKKSVIYKENASA
jgi:hypothetical protein